MKRREFLSTQALLAGSAMALAHGASPIASPAEGQTADTQSASKQSDEPAGSKRVHQSVMGWCFKPMDEIELAKHCKRIGLEAMEGISSSNYDAVTKLGLKISLTSGHGFATGPLDPENHPEVEASLRQAIDQAVKYGAPNVITFTGMVKKGISESAARQNCLACWRRVLSYAEENKVCLVLEHLNTRDDSHPMKGHPGYWGDDLERCADLVNAMDSPNFKLLFDIYHVQIMHGDLIRNIRKYHPIIGHYHTAGNPGRGELDENQEINYPAVIRAIVDTGYDGYIAQEFIPTSDDPIASLQYAYELCDV